MVVLSEIEAKFIRQLINNNSITDYGNLAPYEVRSVIKALLGKAIISSELYNNLIKTVKG